MLQLLVALCYKPVYWHVHNPLFNAMVQIAAFEQQIAVRQSAHPAATAVLDFLLAAAAQRIYPHRIC